MKTKEQQVAAISLAHDLLKAIDYQGDWFFRRRNKMELSLKAILARFKGDYEQAKEYCAFVASEHPRLREEYQGYVAMLGAPESGIEKHWKEEDK